MWMNKIRKKKKKETPSENQNSSEVPLASLQEIVSWELASFTTIEF